jgi:aryl-alcohol dehydrogenase-like predicted oxidoreductase
MGYRIEASGPGGRVESVDVIGEVVRISISADWLEGEIDVELQALGHAAIPLGSVVDLGQVHGLHLRRISRSVTRDELVSTLTKVVDALVAQAPGVLAETPEGLARLGRVSEVERRSA